MRKHRRYILKVLALTVTAVLLTVTVSAHGGRTDSQGGHNSPDGYHYHHGYPAHQHYNGKCPFETEVKTDQSGTTAKSTAGVSASSASENIDSELSSLRKDLRSCNEELVKQTKYKDRLAVAVVILSGTIVILSALLWMWKRELKALGKSLSAVTRERNDLKRMCLNDPDAEGEPDSKEEPDAEGEPDSKEEPDAEGEPDTEEEPDTEDLPNANYKETQQQPNRCIFCGSYTKGTKECFCPQCFNIRRGLYFVFCLVESSLVVRLCGYGNAGLILALLFALAYKIGMVFYMKSLCVFVPIPLFYMVYKPPLKKDLEEAKRISISPIKPTRSNRK